MPLQTQERYIKQNKKSAFQVWRFNNRISVLSPQKTLRIQVDAKATVHWTDDDWKTKHTAKTKDYDIGIFVADIKPKKKKADKIEFTFYWDEAGNRENKNYSVEIEND